MKLITILLFAGCLQLSANGYTQGISIAGKNLTLQTIFKEVEKQSGYQFFYNERLLRNAQRVTIDMKGAELNQVLNECFRNQPFGYAIVERTIVVKRKNTLPEPQGSAVEILQLDIKGKVINQNGEPVEMVTVTVQGTDRATATNADGVFEFKNISENATLIFTGTNIQTQEIRVNNRTEIIVQVTTRISQLDEVQVIAYGRTARRFNTGSVSSVTSEIIQRQPVSNPLAALQGRVAGLLITASNGSPASGFDVRIRGENSIKNGNDPLYIIDGVPYISGPLNQFAGAGGKQSPLNSINPADIERIDVLKDADATAIYGSRAANGVILITTKKGKAGTSQVNANIYTGISKVSRKLDMLSTKEYLDMRKEAFENDGIVATEANAPDLLLWDQNAYTDWQDMLIGNTARLWEAQVSVSGGSAQTRFLLSSSFRNENTVVLGDQGYRRGGLLFNIDHSNVNGKFNISASVNVTTDKNKSVPTDITQYIDLAPNYPIYDEEGALYWFSNEQNPFAYLKRNYETNTTNLLANSVLRYTLLPGLNIRANLGYTQTSMSQLQTLPNSGFNPLTAPGSTGQYGSNKIGSYIIEPHIDYLKTIGSGKLNVLLGASWQESITQGNYLRGSGYASDELLKSMQAATSLTVVNNLNNLYRYNSVFGRVNYNLLDKYLLNATFRRDGSSRFGPGKRFGNFGAVGAAWIFSNEQAISDALPFLSFGKLRGSYGSTGNDQIGDYQYLDTWSATSFPYGGQSGLYPTRVYNPNYSWEVNKKLEAALELGFLNDRILFSTSYYNNRSGNQLVGYALSSQSGFTSYTANLPALVENSGWEVEINTRNIRNQDLTWNTSLNISFPKNKLLEYPGLASSADANSYEIGQSIRVVKGFKFLGVNEQTGIPEFFDVNGNGSLAENQDYVVMGTTIPTFFGGFSNDFNYKRLQLSIFFQFVKQEGPMIDYGPLSSGYGVMKNKDLSALERWSKPGEVTVIPKAAVSSSAPSYTAFRNYYRYSDAVWGDASFIRLKNISLSYNISAFTSRYKIQNSSIYFQGQNLITITNYRGLDPETKGFDRELISQVNPFGSVKPLSLPVLRSYTIGLRFQL